MNSFLLFFLCVVTIVAAEDRCDLFFDCKSPSFPNLKGKCKTQYEAYARALCNNEAWAFDMFDATTKLPVGLRTGNVKDLGNFDQCVDVDHDTGDVSIKGKHCFAGLLLPLEIPDDLRKTLPDLLHRNKSEIPDVKYPPLEIDLYHDFKKPKASFDNKTVLLYISLCLPDECLPSEICPAFPSNDENCVINEVDIDGADISFIVFVGVVLLIVVCSTVYDIHVQKNNKKPAHIILVAFSVYTNGRKLVSTNKSPNQMLCLNGMKCWSMLWVLGGHRFSSSEDIPHINANYYQEWWDSTHAQYMQGARVGVDTFFFISGILLAYGMIPALMRMKKAIAKKGFIGKMMAVIIGTLNSYIHRYLRLTPALAVLFYLHVTIYQDFQTGPLWSFVYKPINDACRKYWWSFYLYIQNYYNPEDLCMVHTWYLSMDMQMFIASPFILWPIVIFPKFAIYFLGLLVAVFTAIPFYVMYDIDPGMYTEEYWNKYYYATHTRLAPWLIGILMGALILQNRNKKFKISKILNVCIWAFVIAGMGAIIFCGSDIDKNYTQMKGALYTALHRPAWAIGCGWIIWACLKGYGGFFNTFFSLSVFQILGRLTYCMYLIHFSVIGYWDGHLRYAGYFDDFSTLYLVCGDIMWVTFFAVIWTLVFESPMITVEKVIFGGAGGGGKKKEAKPALPVTKATEEATTASPAAPQDETAVTVVPTEK